MIQGPIEGQRTTDKELLEIRKGFQYGITMSQTYHRMLKRHGFDDKPKLIAEWRKMKTLFGCGSSRIDYYNGWRYSAPQPPTQAELDTPTGSALAGGRTYGDWAGITGPGKQLREMLAKGKIVDK